MTRRAEARDGQDTRTRLLDSAQAMAQAVGYGGFSYHDLAREVGITTASIHHHFPGKHDLGRALMVRYRERFAAALAAIDEATADRRARLEHFVELFRATLAAGDRLCLCGMLASEHAKLPPGVQDEVRRFFLESEAWLARTLEDGRREGSLRYAGDPADVGRTFFSALEGAMIAARTFGDHARLAATGSLLLMMISPPAPVPEPVPAPEPAPRARPKR